MKTILKKFTKVLGLGLVTLSLIQCSDQEPVWKSKDKTKAVATTTMVADLVRVIGGDEVEVYGLMDAGVNPHSYEGTPRDTMALKSSDLVFFSGLHLEHKMAERLEKMDRAHAVTSKMEKSDLIFPAEEFAIYGDPHVWGDPILWSKGVQVVVDALSVQEPANAATYQRRGDSYVKELNELKVWVTNRLNEIPAERRFLVTSHDAFMYFSRAYGLEVRAMDGLSPDDKAGPKKVKELVQFIQDKKLKTIFPEHAVNEKRIQAIAQEAGISISNKKLFSDATGKLGKMETVGDETYDLGSYIGMQKHNVNAIVEGLK